MATTRLMPLHVGKGRNISTAISDIIDYVENPQKTDFGKFIYGYECDTRLADAEFLLSKRQYANLTGRNQGADDVIAYHLRQAFKPGEVTPEEANQIGRELALKLTKGNHAFVVCTHVDKHHAKTLAQDHVLTAELIERLIERIEIDHERNIHVTFRFKNEFQGKAVEPCATM